MTTNIWARLVNSAVAELLTVPSTLVPGKDIPAEWTDNVTAVTGIAVGWVKGSNGTFGAPPPPTLASVQATQIAMLRAACSAAIIGGFTSSALGSAYTYPSSSVEQANMQANAVAGGDFMCESPAGVWALVSHTAAQAQAVLQSFIAFRDTARGSLATLTAQVNAATTIAAAQAVVWP